MPQDRNNLYFEPNVREFPVFNMESTSANVFANVVQRIVPELVRFGFSFINRSFGVNFKLTFDYFSHSVYFVFVVRDDPQSDLISDIVEMLIILLRIKVLRSKLLLALYPGLYRLVTNFRIL